MYDDGEINIFMYLDWEKLGWNPYLQCSAVELENDCNRQENCKPLYCSVFANELGGDSFHLKQNEIGYHLYC